MSRRTILSLFDYSGSWCLPYSTAGYRVIMVDLKHGQDILTFKPPKRVHGILAAPPCTDFSVSGAQYWKVKDTDGRTAHSIALVNRALDIICDTFPQWWVLENPVGRLNQCVPRLQNFGPWYFQPHWYGDAYMKKTGLWGSFNKNLPRNDVSPIRSSSQGSWIQNLGGKLERTKELISMTPPGFAQAFFTANP